VLSLAQIISIGLIGLGAWLMHRLGPEVKGASRT
jgi:hypothetical protein